MQLPNGMILPAQVVAAVLQEHGGQITQHELMVAIGQMQGMISTESEEDGDEEEEASSEEDADLESLNLYDSAEEGDAWPGGTEDT